jgi:hypothetical protein
MHKRIIAVLVAAVLLPAGGSTQERTERFIPIGQSPGISGVYSMVGTVRAANPATRSVTVQGGGDTWTVRITESTDIWIDRSAALESSLVGDWSDLEVGQTVEIKCVDYQTKAEADWVKVGVPPPAPLS